MNRVSALIEFIGSLSLLCFGFYLFHAGYADNTANLMIKLPIGAALIFCGGLAIAAVARSYKRYVRRMQRD
jgi:hypothetical protein